MDRIKEMLDRLSELSDEELSELKALILGEFETIETQDPTAETVQQMTDLADALETVKGAEDTRKAEAENLATQAADAAARVRGLTDDSEETAEGEDPAQDSADEESDEMDKEEEPVFADSDTPETPETPEVIAEETAEPIAAAADVAEAEPEVQAEAEAQPETPEAEAEVVAEAESVVEAAAAEAEAEEPAPEADQIEPVATDEPVTPVDAESQVQQETIEESESNQEAPVTASADGQEVVVQAPEDALPVPRETAAVAITAGADIPGVTAGSEISNMGEVAELFTKRLHSLRNVNGGDGEQSIVASLNIEYPESRTLYSSNGTENWDKIQNVVSAQAITAAGGYCAPLEVRYDLFGMGVTDRPVKDALASFRADRGGLRYTDPPVLADYSGAVGLWTAATDASPGTATKPCLTVTCGSEVTVTVDAVTLCLQFGNLMTRAYPELVARNNELAMIQHARYAELQLLAKVKAAGTNLTAAKDLGAARDILDQINKAAAGYRYRHRLSPSNPLRFMAPAWLKDAFRSDISKQMPGDSDDQHALADARISRWFAARNINPSWTLEGLPTYAGPGVGTTSVLEGFPATVEWDLFAEGTFLFLDGGTLDVGIIRDSTLVGTNDYKQFMETFEGVAQVGPESLHVTSTFAATGEAQALADTVA